MNQHDAFRTVVNPPPQQQDGLPWRYYNAQSLPMVQRSPTDYDSPTDIKQYDQACLMMINGFECLFLPPRDYIQITLPRSFMSLNTHQRQVTVFNIPKRQRLFCAAKADTIFNLFNVAESDKCNPFLDQPNGAITFKYTSKCEIVNIDARTQLEESVMIPPNAVPFKAYAVLTMRGVRQCDSQQPSLLKVNVSVAKIIIEEHCEPLAFDNC